MLPNYSEAIAKFIFLTFLDDVLAFEAVPHAVAVFERNRKKYTHMSDGALIVLATRACWASFRKRLFRGKPGFQLGQRWTFDQAIEFPPWQEFQKKSMEDELHILVWSRVLGISYRDISEGLGVTEGTVRYRMNRALRKLGDAIGPAND